MSKYQARYIVVVAPHRALQQAQDIDDAADLAPEHVGLVVPGCLARRVRRVLGALVVVDMLFEPEGGESRRASKATANTSRPYV